MNESINWLHIPLHTNIHIYSTNSVLPCAAVWAWSPWWTHIYRAHSSECQSSWSTAVDRTDGRSAGSQCSGMVWSEDSRHPLHSDKSYGSQSIQSTRARGKTAVIGGRQGRGKIKKRKVGRQSWQIFPQTRANLSFGRYVCKLVTFSSSTYNKARCVENANLFHTRHRCRKECQVGI